MQNYKAVLCYDGSKYGGFQKQPGAIKTIQGELEEKLKMFFGHKTDVIASGRTDKGVHAYHQVINFKSEKPYGVEDVQEFLNENLDNDIFISKIEYVDDRFHSRYNAKSKTYIYKILNSKNRDPFKRRYMLFFPEKLNVDRMERATKYFIGEKDFASMTSLKNNKKSTVRTVNYIKIIQNNYDIEIHINADGFLYNMVRIIVGTLIEVGDGTLQAGDVEKILESKVRSNAGRTIAPHGLYLSEVLY